MALEAVRQFQSGRLGNPDDPVTWGPGGAPSNEIVNQSRIAGMASADAHESEQARFDREEEKKYAGGLSYLRDPPP